MCGILGTLDFSKRIDEQVRAEFSSTLSLLEHRGPDAQQYSEDDHYILGHSRLSIIDTHEHANQPFISADGRYKLVYNGEIYNFVELKQQLLASGVSFNTQSDTEVLFQMLITEGEQAIAKLNGMFAFAFVDTHQQTALLAKDRYGIKPLYYAHHGSTLNFSSELHALSALTGAANQLNVSAIPEYLQYGSTLGDKTFFSGTNKLLAGHFMRLSKDGGVQIEQYWSPADSQEIDVSYEQARDTVKEKLHRAVERHLVADVDIGIFLSGGIDSSAVTLLASKLTNKPLNTYSVAYDFQGAVNELAKAKSVAAAAGTNHHELFIESNNVQSVIESLVTAHGQPFGDAANIPLYMLAERMNGNPKVILQGDGGDEIFAGYHRYLRTNLSGWAKLARPALPMMAKVFGENSRFYRGLRTLNAFSSPDASLTPALIMAQESPFKNTYRCFKTDFAEQLLQTSPFARYQAVYADLAKFDDIKRLMFTDMSILLPDVYFEKVDRSTMQKSIEVRVPFMDNELVDYTMSLPSSIKTQNGLKGILKSALEGTVDDSILYGPKTGFGVPFAHWYKTSLYDFARGALLDGKMADAGIIDRKGMEQCLLSHKNGSEQNGFLINKMVQMALWYERYV